MTTDLIRLVWQRQAAGYEIRQYERSRSQVPFPSAIVSGDLPPGLYLWPKAGETEEFVVEWTNYQMLLDFLSIERDADAALQYVTKWGSPVKEG